MKYFMTGITGFIGSNLSKILIGNGHTVHALVRRTAGIRQQEIPGIRFFYGDLQDRESLRKGMEGCDLAFHLAAFTRPWSKDVSLAYKINVEGTLNVFFAAREARLKKVIFASSAATMSPSSGADAVNEDKERSVPFFNDYELTKYLAEDLARQFSADGLPVVIVNPSRVYGPGPITIANSLTRIMNGFFKGTWRIIPGKGDIIGNYVFIEDVVRGLCLASDHGHAGERYILGGENLSFDELFATLGNISGRHQRMIHLPVWIMSGIADLMAWQARLTGIPPAITRPWVNKYLNDWILSSDKAIRELGYRITPFAEGARITYLWLNETEREPQMRAGWWYAQ